MMMDIGYVKLTMMEMEIQTGIVHIITVSGITVQGLTGVKHGGKILC